MKKVMAFGQDGERAGAQSLLGFAGEEGGLLTPHLVVG